MSEYKGQNVLLRPPDHTGKLIEEGDDPLRGPFKTFEWRGALANILSERDYQFVTLKRKVVRTYDDALDEWILRATTGANEDASKTDPLVDRWTMHWNYEQKAIWSNPILLAEFRKVRGLDSAHTVAQIKKDMISLSKGDDVVARGATVTTDDDVTITFEVLKKLWTDLGMNGNVFDLLMNDLLDGVTERELSQCVIRHTRIVPSNTDLRAEAANRGKMLSSLSGEGLPPDQVFSEPLPQGGFWLKMRPEIDQTSADKWTIEDEYWHAEDFSKLNFGEAV